MFERFIEENHVHKLESRQAQHSRVSNEGAASQDLMSYWGYKFETLSLLPAPWAETSRDYIEGRENLVVNNKAQYCSVVKTGIGKSRLILGGEVDARKPPFPASLLCFLKSSKPPLLPISSKTAPTSVWDAKPTSPSSTPINWVELKTAATPQSDRDILKYERKLLKFWVQSFLLGVPKIVVGFRTKEGLLQSLEELTTEKIPMLVKQRGKGSWDGNVCINFTAGFLEWLSRTIVEDGGVWRIRKREKVPVIEVVKVEEIGHGDILSREFLHWRCEPKPFVEQSNA
ncbi:MAG: hypothetical protein L6R39_005203 [Caloplaca ligustica]|nr:MAG: hypothetical protein L6R39_005203 [Caloplaca ligustica]